MHQPQLDLLLHGNVFMTDVEASCDLFALGRVPSEGVGNRGRYGISERGGPGNCYVPAPTCATFFPLYKVWGSSSGFKGQYLDFFNVQFSAPPKIVK